MARMILKFNAAVGRDPLPELRELAAALGVRIEAIAEETVAGKRLKVLHLAGESAGLAAFERKLLRFPAVTAKLVAS